MKRSMRARFRSAAAVIAAAAQLVLCSASVLEVRFGSDARAHVEANGTRLHHAHNDADCAACTGRHLLGSSKLESPKDLSVSSLTPATHIDTESVVRVVHRSDAHSRAPPALPV